MNSELSRPELPPINFLAEISEEDRLLLSAYGVFLPVSEDKDLITEGDSQDSLYLVLSGLLHVVREKNGVRTLLWRVTAGETIGEINLFDPSAASASVEAKEFSQVWKVSREDLQEFIRNYPVAGAQLMVAVAGLLSRRLRAMNQRFATLQEALVGHHAWQ